jgi:type II secretory pathway component HofQ
MNFRFFLLLWLMPAVAFSYTVVRKDGKQFDGELIRETEDVISLKDKDGLTINFQKDQIDWNKTTQARQEEESQTKSKVTIAPVRLDEPTITIPLKEQKWSGEPISVDFKDADVRDLFIFIADFAQMNLILDPAVGGTVTLKMTEVPWDQLLDVVCKNFGYGWEIDGNVVSIDRE